MAGETVRFVVTASQPGTCCLITLTPGDGGTATAPANAMGCTAGPGGTEGMEFTYDHAPSGTWTVEARAGGGPA